MATPQHKPHSLKEPIPWDGQEEYRNWRIKIGRWLAQTQTPAEKQGPALSLVLSGPADEVALQFPDAQLNSSTGARQLLDALDKRFKKNSEDEIWEVFRIFVRTKRHPRTSMKIYVTDFLNRLSRLKSFLPQAPDGNDLIPKFLESLFLLENANLPDDDIKLILASSGMKLDNPEVIQFHMKRMYEIVDNDLSHKKHDDVHYGNSESSGSNSEETSSCNSDSSMDSADEEKAQLAYVAYQKAR